MKPYRVPVLKPKLPASSDLLPLLQEIDERRWYSNHGPLVLKLEDRLSRHFGVEVTTNANATLGITAALLAYRIPKGTLCIMPSWTFAASPHAARAANLIPWFHDVDRNTWALDPESVIESLSRLRQSVGAILVVSPFGAPIDVASWERFESDTGVPVVIDAAAGFDTLTPSHIPAVVSLHATKILGAGEGGFLATSDQSLRDLVMSACNFGFRGSRMARAPALNAKMSEYHAAVALVNFQCWPKIRELNQKITGWYTRAIADVEGVSLQPGYGNGWVSGTTNILLPPRTLARVARALAQWGIETRQWWGHGCHTQAAFTNCPRGALNATTELGNRVLGLPHFVDMQESEVQFVCEALRQAIIARVQRIA